MRHLREILSKVNQQQLLPLTSQTNQRIQLSNSVIKLQMLKAQSKRKNVVDNEYYCKIS